MAGEEETDRLHGPSDRSNRARFSPRGALFWVVVVFPSAVLAAAWALRALPDPAWLTVPVAVVSGIATVGPLGIVAYPVVALTAAAAALSGPRHLRASRLWIALAFGVGFAALVPVVPGVRSLRMRNVRHVPERARPLVSALARYHQARQRYPTALSDLVPGYVGRIPYTGMMGYPKFEYRGPGKARSEAGGYDLYVDCSIGIFVFDSLHYWPSQGYPEKAYGGDVERVDGWAYVHE